MNKTEYREAVRTLLKEQVGDLSLDDKHAIVRQCLIELQEAAAFDDGN